MGKAITQTKSGKSDSKPKQTSVVKPPINLPIWLVTILFAITTIIFFWEQLLQHSFFWEDFVEYVFPVQTFAAREFAKWSIPFWNPFTFNGMPFIADLQVGFFYPLNRLLSIVFISGNNLPVIAIEIAIIIHFLAAQMNVYVLARHFKVSSFGAILSALSYSFSMLMVCHVIHPMIVYHLAWFPLVLMFFLKGLETKKLYFSIYAGIIYGFSMLSGHPQMTLYEGLFLFFVFAWYFVAGLKKKEIAGKGIIFSLSASIIPIAVAAGIFAIQYLPSAELAKLSQRNEITYEKATEGSLQFKNIYTAIVPKIFGSVQGSDEKNMTYYLESGGNVQRHFYWETAFYFGLVALFLGLYGAALNYRKREGALFIFLAIFGFLYALGDGSFVFNIFYGLPLFGSFRNPGRMMFFTIMAFSLLAGFGFDSLWKDRKKINIIYLLVAGIIPLLILFLVSSGSLLNTFNAPEIVKSGIQDSATTSLILLLIAIAVALLVERTVLIPMGGGIVLAIIVMIDLYMAGASFNQNPNNPAKAYELKPDIKTMLTPTLPKDIFRVNMRLFQPVRFMAMQRNQGLIDNMMLIEGYNPLILDRVRPPVDSPAVIHDLYNVRYEVKVDLQKGSWAFVERNSYYPRAWLVNSFKVFKPEDVASKMKSGNYNYRNEVILEEEPAVAIPYAIPDTIKDDIICTEYNNNNFKYKVKTSQPSIMCFSEIWYPSWKSYIDGKPVKTLRADYCFRAVAVPQGEHIVEMKYESSSFTLGAYISGITLLLGVLGLLFSHRFQQ